LKDPVTKGYIKSYRLIAVCYLGKVITSLNGTDWIPGTDVSGGGCFLASATNDVILKLPGILMIILAGFFAIRTRKLYK
jgi:hypothetical protein